MSEDTKKTKQVVIDEIRNRFDNSASVVVVNYLGLTVSEADEMRKNLRDENVSFTVYKNTLVKRAIVGTPYENISSELKGPSAFAFCEEDATAGARIIKKSIKKYNKMEFKAAVIEGTVCNRDEVEKIADIPSRELLIARFMGSIQSPVAQLVRTFKAIADDQEAPAAESAEA